VLFLGHLTIEKTLKAIIVSKLDVVPPFTHRLTYLAEKADLSLSSEQLELLEIVTDFNQIYCHPKRLRYNSSTHQCAEMEFK